MLVTIATRLEQEYQILLMVDVHGGTIVPEEVICLFHVQEDHIPTPLVMVTCLTVSHAVQESTAILMQE